MRHVTVFGALCAVALASPAYAKDNSGYIGFDAGLLFPSDTDIDNNDGDYEIGIDHKMGYDLDIIAGYDFGWVRAEGELAWKWVTHKEYDVAGLTIDESGDGETDIRSAMINILGDFGNDRWNFYAGGGIGYALVDMNLDVGADDESWKDGGLAYQGIAGVRYSVNEMIDVGLKYRYFDTSQLEDDVGNGDDEFDFTSHSIMFSMIYNWGGERYVAPPPAPVYVAPPPPPPPATQTCPDGSVILATDMCPPPPPPPPPPPEPERG